MQGGIVPVNPFAVVPDLFCFLNWHGALPRFLARN
jgi:hypothetical protein